MAKIDTINKYAESYLAGKNDSAKEKFWAKSIDKQYQSIMTWRYNQRKRGDESEINQEVREMIDDVRNLKRRIDKCKILDEQILDELEKEINLILAHVGITRSRIRAEEIARLEDQQAEIKLRLEELRRDMNEPNQGGLFD